jgi:hypothetical protein
MRNRADNNQEEIVKGLRAIGASNTEKQCLNCGVVFHVKPSHYDRSTYCSKSCMAEHYKSRLKGQVNPNYRQAKDKVCLGCGKTFHPNNNNKTYCSSGCYNKSEQKSIDAKKANDGNRRSNVKCKKCGTEIPYTRRMCDECKPKPKKNGACMNCGKEVGSTYDVMYCKECRSKGLHKKEVFSICVRCGATINGIPNRKYCNFCWGQTMRINRGIPRKKDANQNEIVEALERYGCSVIDASAIGGGCPDIFVGKNGVTLLIEIKNPNAKGKLNKLQERWHAGWKGQVAVVYTIAEAIKIVDELCVVRSFEEAMRVLESGT